VELPPGRLRRREGRAKARRKLCTSVGRWIRGLRVEGPCVERFVREGAWYLRCRRRASERMGRPEAVAERSVENLFRLKRVERRSWSL